MFAVEYEGEDCTRRSKHVTGSAGVDHSKACDAEIDSTA